MERKNAKGFTRKNSYIIGIGAVILLAAVIAVVFVAAGNRAQGDDTAQNDAPQNDGMQDGTGAAGDTKEMNGADGIHEADGGEPVTAVYVPYGEGAHIFVGEQAGVFVATFPEEIYDINGNKITKEQLVKGNVVEIYGNGMMLESYPGQYPGITKMKVVEEGKPSDADAYQDIVDEIYQEPDPSEPPSLNVGYTTDLADVTVMVNRGGYEWVYTDKDGLSTAVVADSVHVLDWKIGEELADIKIKDSLDLTLYFSAEPEAVEAVRYDASLLGKVREYPEGEKITVGKKDGQWVLAGVTGGYVYDITGMWENGRADYGFIVLVQE